MITSKLAINWKRNSLILGSVGAFLAFSTYLAINYLLPGAHDHSGHLHNGNLHGGHLHGAPGPFFENLFKVYTPRRHCMFQEPGVIWLHFVSDLLIAASYFSIPVAIIVFVKKREDFAFTWIFWLFASFILLCGTTHLIAMWDLWEPMYKIEGLVKLATGIVSIFTAITLWPLIPKALAMPSPAMLEAKVEERTEALAKANLEREKALEAEKILRSEAERINKLKDEFLATLSHELRTPLNAILGWSQILKGKVPDEDHKLGLEIIERNARSQTRLVEDLLDVSRIITGKLKIDVQKVDLTEVIDSAAATVQPAADAKDIRLQKIIDPDAGLVSGDPARLQQIIWNLLNNAVKFTPKGGRVQIFLERKNSQVEIIISDSGIGVTPEFLPYLFERFTQSDSSTTRIYGGLGLGLAIVRHLVELHGGSVKATSSGVDEGSVFTVTLPVQAGSVSHQEERSLPAETFSEEKEDELIRLDNVIVLAIDDEPDALSLIETILSMVGAHVFTALSAADAFQILKNNKPDIILCDLGMPVEDGYTFLRKVRKFSIAEGGEVPAIAITAFARSEDRTKSMRAGFQLHISKPFEASELLVAVSALTSKKKIPSR